MTTPVEANKTIAKPDQGFVKNIRSCPTLKWLGKGLKGKRQISNLLRILLLEANMLKTSLKITETKNEYFYEEG